MWLYFKIKSDWFSTISIYFLHAGDVTHYDRFFRMLWVLLLTFSSFNKRFLGCSSACHSDVIYLSGWLIFLLPIKSWFLCRCFSSPAFLRCIPACKLISSDNIQPWCTLIFLTSLPFHVQFDCYSARMALLCQAHRARQAPTRRHSQRFKIVTKVLGCFSTLLFQIQRILTRFLKFIRSLHQLNIRLVHLSMPAVTLRRY